MSIRNRYLPEVYLSAYGARKQRREKKMDEYSANQLVPRIEWISNDEIKTILMNCLTTLPIKDLINIIINYFDCSVTPTITVPLKNIHNEIINWLDRFKRNYKELTFYESKPLRILIHKAQIFSGEYNKNNTQIILGCENYNDFKEITDFISNKCDVVFDWSKSGKVRLTFGNKYNSYHFYESYIGVVGTLMIELSCTIDRTMSFKFISFDSD